jgi:hypothetical protein
MGLIFAGLAVGLVAGVIRQRGRPEPWRPTPELALVVVIAAAAPLGTVAYGLVGDSVFLERNLIASWPGLALLLGAILMAGRGPAAIAATALVVAGFTLGGIQMLDADEQRTDYLSAAEFIEDTGEPGSPVVEVPLLAPGPQTSLEYALAEPGEPVPEGREVISLLQPTFEERLAARGPDRVHQTALRQISPPTGAEAARIAAREAGDGSVFLVIPGEPTLDEVRDLPGPAGDFLNELPPRFTEAESRRYPGLGPFDLTVFRLEG